MIENKENAYGDKLTLEEYQELSSQLNETKELNGIKDLDLNNEIYAKLEHHLERIYETDFEDLDDDEQVILLQSLMRIGGKIGPE